ncbi:MAG: hypothetical protein K2W78_10650 [Xanthobacteraceae bacterium]|nr:hypothetical protein [Xanthobacteraceae bacterium]
MRKGDAKRDRIGNGTDSVGWTGNMFGEEEEHGRRLLWRLGTWAVATVLTVASAAWINNTSAGLRRERQAYTELSRQAQQFQSVAKNAQDETKRLASAITVLNTDRDRLFTRVTSIEQGLDSVTGSIAKQASTPSWPPFQAGPVLSAPPLISAAATSPPEETAPIPKRDAHAEPPHKETTPKEQNAAVSVPQHVMAPSPKPSETKPSPAQEQKSEQQPTAKPQQTAALPPAPIAAAAPPAAPNTSSVLRTDFAVDLGSANSVEGLRALWRGGVKGWPALIGSLTPLIVIKEGHDGLGLRLHLVAGPIQDAAAAAKLCASLIASRHICETTVFDGQLLSVNTPPVTTASVPTREKSRRKSRAQPEKPVEEPQRPQPQQQPPPQQQSSGFLSIFGSR